MTAAHIWWTKIKNWKAPLKMEVATKGNIAVSPSDVFFRVTLLSTQEHLLVIAKPINNSILILRTIVPSSCLLRWVHITSISTTMLKFCGGCLTKLCTSMELSAHPPTSSMTLRGFTTSAAQDKNEHFWSHRHDVNSHWCFFKMHSLFSSYGQSINDTTQMWTFFELKSSSLPSPKHKWSSWHWISNDPFMRVQTSCEMLLTCAQKKP